MKAHLLFCLLITAGAAAELAALTVTVKTVGPDQGQAQVTAVVRRADGGVDPRVLRLAVNATTVVEDLGGGTWEIGVTSDTLWAAPVFASASDSVMLQLWSRGSISGKLGGRAPSTGEFIVSFSPATDAPGPTGMVVCPFVSGDWHCSLPAGKLDLRFSLTGFATEFRWAVMVANGTDVGQLALTPGSSVFGKVQLPRPSKGEALKDVEVSASPINVSPAFGKVPRYTTGPDPRGFFQIRGLPPGSYGLYARTKTLSSEKRKVEIIEQTNASLRSPLVLAMPARVLVRITPPLDLHRRQWQVTLLKRGDADDHLDVVDRSLASRTGEWSQNRLLPGDYRMMIQEEDGSEWKSESLILSPDDGDRLIEVVLTSQQVRGTVTLGDRPIAAATINFGGENGPGLITDERGRFEGEVPPIADEISMLLVTSSAPDIKRMLRLKGERSPDGDLQFDIVLPATVIAGRTVNEDGSIEPDAIVTLQSREHDEFFEQMFTDENGAFQFEGFEPGGYSLQADAFEKASAVLDVEVGGDAAASVNLILRPQEQVRGLISMRGVPIVGADVYALPRDTNTSILPKGRSDATGRFFLALPPGTKLYDAIVFPRGFSITAARIVREPKRKDLRVEVGQDGGSLTVDAPDDQEMLLLVHAAGEFSLQWVAEKAGGTVTSGGGRRRLTVPNLESGPYSVCRKKKCESVYVPRFASASLTLGE
jgi:hypothetical protein